MVVMSTIFFIWIITIISVCYGHDGTKWDYKGRKGLSPPKNWKEVSHFCDSSSFRQSPINIDTSFVLEPNEHKICAPTNELDWNLVGYKRHLKAKNNGHSLSLIPISQPGDAGFELNRAHNTIGELINWWNVKGNIEENQFYCLHSFHFHWGSTDAQGSEHTIDNKQYPLEIHWVHFSCDYDSLAKSISSWEGLLHENKDPFVLGVVGIFFEIGEANPALEQILKNSDKLIHSEDDESVIIENVNLYNLIPSDGLRHYYTYLGSLTTPPCTPIVKWHILESKLTVSEDQINRFRALKNDIDFSEAPNYRPIQHNNPKEKVYECVSEDF